MSEDIYGQHRQNHALEGLAAQIALIEQSNVTAENIRVALEQEKAAVKEYLPRRNPYSQRDETQASADEDNSRYADDLKAAAAKEQQSSQRYQYAANNQHYLDYYLTSQITGEYNRLAALENDIRMRASYIWTSFRSSNVPADSPVCNELRALQLEAQQEFARAREKLAEISGLIYAERVRLEGIKSEAVEDIEQVSQRKKFNLEKLVGLKLLNIIGIILIIIGVITAGQFAYLRLGDIWRSLAIFVLGAVFLGAGEFFNRKKPSFFSLSITAGGVGILYAALAVSYFAFGVFNMYAAIAICIVITALAFFLSTRYNTQVILIVALVGGYLPILHIGPDRTLLFAIMGYFALLNLLALLVAFRKNWPAARFVGLGLNIIGMVYISLQVGYPNPLSYRVVETVYIAFAILIYTVIPLIATYRAKTGFRGLDTALLSINTFAGAIIMFINIRGAGWSDHFGMVCAAFATVYLGLALLVNRKFENSKTVFYLFHITGLSFAALFIPFQFSSAWWTVGWLALGTAFAVCGIIKDNRLFKISGFTINGVALSWFMLVDITRWIFTPSYIIRDIIYDSYFAQPPQLPAFFWQYMAVTAASVLIMAAFIFKKSENGPGQKAFKYVTALNIWLYAIYLISQLENVLLRSFTETSLDIGYLMGALTFVATLILAIVFSLKTRIYDAGMRAISIILNVLGVFGILVLNLAIRPVAAPMADEPAIIIAIATATLVTLGIIGAYAVYSIVRQASSSNNGGQYIALLVSAFVVVFFTINLIRAYDLSFTSFWLSIGYVLTALAWIILGFVKRHNMLRRFGLGLALISVAKLFLIDLHTLGQGFRIISYFALGLSLITISFFYQHFSKRLDESGESAEKVKETVGSDSSGDDNETEA